MEWKPERWLAGAKGVPDAVKGVPGVWGNVLSFLGGPKACIGYRFSLYECVLSFPTSFLTMTLIVHYVSRTKIILHALVSAFGFELAVPKEEIAGRGGMVARPVLKSKLEEGGQLPLIVKRVEGE
jgi:hypothetical protein